MANKNNDTGSVNDNFKEQIMKDLRYVSDFQKQIEAVTERINKSQANQNSIKKSKKELDEIKKTVQEVEKMGRYIRFNIQMGVEVAKITKPVSVVLKVKNSLQDTIKKDFEGVKKALKFDELGKIINTINKPINSFTDKSANAINSMPDKWDNVKGSKAFKLISKPIEYTIKTKEMIKKLTVYALNNDAVLKRVAETKKEVNSLKKNIAITIAAKNTAKESINKIKSDLKSMVSKPFTVIIEAKNKTKKVIDGVKNTIFGKTSKKIFNSTIGEAMKREDKFASNSDGATNTASAQIKNIKESFTGLGANLVGVKDDGQIEKGGAFDTFKQQLSKILPLLDALKKSDAFKVIQKDLSSLVSGAGSKFSAFTESLMKNPDKLKQQFNKLWTSLQSGVAAIVKLGTAAASLAVKLKPLFDIMAKHPKTVIGLFAAFKIGIPVISSVATAFTKFKEIKKDIGLLSTSIKVFTSGSTSSLLSLFKVVMKSPITLIILGIIAVVIILYKAWTENWGGIREKTKEVMDKVNSAIESVKGIMSSVKTECDTFIKDIKKSWEDLKEFFKNPIQAIVKYTKEGSPLADKYNNDPTNKFALGTSYSPKGWSWVGENGPELMKLPGGTQILDNRTSQNMLGGSVSVGKLADTLVVREDADIDKIADALTKKLTKVGFNCV